jgi:hypothetical protein
LIIMLGSRSWFALMRRNAVYRKRNWVGSVREYIVLYCIIGGGSIHSFYICVS